MYIYICIHTYIYIYIYTYIHTHIHTPVPHTHHTHARARLPLVITALVGEHARCPIGTEIKTLSACSAAAQYLKLSDTTAANDR